MLYCVKPPSIEIKTAERRDDSLWLFSDFGVHRISPKNSRNLRVSVTREKEFSDMPRPAIVAHGGYADWDYELTDSEVVLKTSELVLRIDRAAASYKYYDRSGSLLLSDSGKDPVSLEKFPVFKTVDAETEKVQTADGVKEVVREARRVPDGHSYHARLNLKFAEGEALYGLGQHEEAGGSLRNQTVYLHQANRKIALPVLVSSLGYGILADTYSPLIFSDSEFGSYIYSEAVPELEYYFMYGGDMRGVVAQYRFLTGKAVMLPKWAFGYFQSQERFETQEEIERTVGEYRRRGIGLDCIVLDWCSWEDGKWGEKSFDGKRFPDPDGMTERLHSDHTHFMISVWANPSESTDNYKEFKEAGLLLPGCGIYNALSPEGRRMYWEQAKRGLFCHGIDAWWCDNSEPIDPEWNHIEKPEPARMYEEYCRDVGNCLPIGQTNAYGLYHALGIYEGQRGETDKKRVCNLTRSAYIGQQRCGAILWSGDVAATWDTLAGQVAAGLNFCASGLPYWTTDIGAFFVKRGLNWYWRGDFDGCFDDLGYRELFTRWYQWSAFLPIFRGHGTDCRRELWNCANADLPFYDILLNTNRLRYSLMPYIYSAAGNCWLGDGSMMENLAFDFASDPEVLDIKDQYIFGGSIMVCPVTEPMYYLPKSEKTESTKTRTVYLPKGCGWYDFYTEKYYEGGQYIEADAPIDKIPLFVKEGSIIPFAEPALSTEEQPREITLKIYSGRNAEFTLYEDSGDGYACERGEYLLTKIFWDDSAKKLSAEKSSGWDMTAEELAKRYVIKETKIIEKGE